VRQWVDLGIFALLAVDPAQTGKCVLPVDIHRAGAANTLSARPTKCERWVNLVFDLDQCIKNLGQPKFSSWCRSKGGKGTDHWTSLI
jgi:hypothetical protein